MDYPPHRKVERRTVADLAQGLAHDIPSVHVHHGGEGPVSIDDPPFDIEQRDGLREMIERGGEPVDADLTVPPLGGVVDRRDEVSPSRIDLLEPVGGYVQNPPARCVYGPSVGISERAYVRPERAPAANVRRGEGGLEALPSCEVAVLLPHRTVHENYGPVVPYDRDIVRNHVQKAEPVLARPGDVAGNRLFGEGKVIRLVHPLRQNSPRPDCIAPPLNVSRRLITLDNHRG